MTPRNVECSANVQCIVIGDDHFQTWGWGDGNIFPPPSPHSTHVCHKGWSFWTFAVPRSLSLFPVPCDYGAMEEKRLENIVREVFTVTRRLPNLQLLDYECLQCCRLLRVSVHLCHRAPIGGASDNAPKSLDSTRPPGGIICICKPLV